jgi:hypothetical protein|tara:strand:+ start:460 stop:948 length:489 start_codon:yes stop_codon:yes gene_type:complete
MIWKNAMKYPMLIVGIILFTLFLTSDPVQKYWKGHMQKYIPNTCKAIVQRVEPKVNPDWEFECPGTQRLIIKVDNSDQAVNPSQLKTLLYRKLANTYGQLAQYSNPETVAHLQIVEISIIHKQLTIFSKTDGQAIKELRAKTNPREFAAHLKLTVKVKEILK